MGTIAELQAKPDRSYPLLWLSNEGGSLDQNYKVDNIRLTMFGRVIVGEEGQDDDASEIEVLSDMQLILLDFLNYFHQQHGQDYVTDKAAQLEHFTERTNDRTAGYSCVLELKQFYDWNKCQIPQSGASIPPTVDGLTLYDFCDETVQDRLTDDQVTCLTDWLCTPCEIPSLSVSVSDISPDFGETITITATPTDITPTNYKFYYRTADNLIEIADQASNSFDWLVNQVGNITIVVIATNGTIDVTDDEDIVSTTVFPLDLFSGATECNFLQLMTSTYTGALCTIRRSSDNALKDFYPDFISLTLNSDDGAGTTLGDWIGSDSGYIYRLYSQVSGQDILITTVNEQPRIVNAGVLEVDTNGFASAYFDGSNNAYTLNALAGEARVDAYIVLNSSSTFIVPFGTGATYSFVGQSGSGSTTLYASVGTPLLYANNALQSPTTRDDVWVECGVAQKIITHEALNTSTWANFRIMNYFGAPTQGKLAGIIAWTSDNSANRSAFTTALNTFLNTIY